MPAADAAPAAPPAATDQPRFVVGDIVRTVDDNGAVQRAVIVAHLTADDAAAGRLPLAARPGDYVAQNIDSPSVSTIGRLAAWERVPDGEQGAVDRVRGVLASWDERRVHEGDDPLEWHLLAALLPRDLYDSATNGWDWPTMSELALLAAEWADEWADLADWAHRNAPDGSGPPAASGPLAAGVE